MDTCKWHRRGIWPISLYMALAIETEDLSLPAVPSLSKLDDLIRAKAAGLVPRSRRMYGDPARGESVAAVVAAYREMGTYAAAGRLLDQRHVPTRGGASWQPSMVAWIVQMQGVQL